ncbi:MAG: serine--tRNA ligase, partial [Flavisolibacter sp.]|nr:serine--tRNA ligase [Flavisolibacter sp.]
MLQLATLRNNPEWVKERLAVKNFTELDIVDQIISLDEERRKLTFRFDDTKAKINAASKEIGMLMGKGQKEDAEEKKREVEGFKNTLSPIQQQLEAAEKKVKKLLVRLPNLPSEKVPKGKTPENNEIVRTGGSKPQLSADAVPHWELA